MKTLLTLPIYFSYAALLLAGVFLLRARFKQSTARQRLAITAFIGIVMFVVAQPLRSPFADFVSAYYAGGAMALSGTTDTESLFGQGVHGFVNIPIVTWVFAPFALLPPYVAAGLFFALGVAAMVATWRWLVSLAELDPRGGALLALLMVTNGPLMNSLKEGNTSHWALFAMVYALVSLRANRPVRAGLVLGFATIFKLPLLLLGVWAALRGHLRAALAGGLVLAAAGSASFLLFGVETHVVWYERFVAAAGKHPIAAFNVQSFAAFVARWTQAPEALCSWDTIALAPHESTIASVAVALLFASCGAALLWSKRVTRPRATAHGGRELEFIMIAFLACLTSPLAWTHYYCWALLPIAFLLPSQKNAGKTRVSALLWVAIVLVSLPVAWPWCSPSGPLALVYTSFVSHYLTGGVLLLALLIHRLAFDVHPPTDTEGPSHAATDGRVAVRTPFE